MQAVIAFAQVDVGLIAQFVEGQKRLGRRLSQFDLADSSLVVLGDSGSSLLHREHHLGVDVGFGSAMSHLSEIGLGRMLDEAIGFGRLQEGLAESVALRVTSDGQLTAVAGGGSHRLFARELANGRWVVSTHLASVVAIGDSPAIDRSHEDFLLGFGFTPDGRTIFEGVAELPQLSVWRPNSTVQPLALEPDQAETSEGDLISLLERAVERDAGTSSRCAVLLGGLDSALVCALLKKAGKDVVGFTYDFGVQEYNQSNIELLIKWLGIEHRWVPIDAERVLGAFRQLPDRVNAPSAQPHYQMHTQFAAEEVASEGFSRVFSGDGCDAIFLGFPTVNRRAALMRRLRRLPNPIARGGLSILTARPIDRSLGHVARVARSSLRASTLPYPASGHLPTQYFDDTSLRRLRRGPAPVAAESVEETRIRLASGLEGVDATRLAFLGNGATAASRWKVDGAVMHTGIAQFTPYKDPAVMKLAKALPTSVLRHPGAPSHGLGKAYLIDLVLKSGLLPSEVVLQPKQSPTTSPIDYWYMGELKSAMLEILEDLPFEWDRDYVLNLFEPKLAEELYRKRVSLSHHALQVVGLLASYAAFARLAR